MTDDSVFLAAVLPPQGPYIAASISDGKTWQKAAASISELVSLNTQWRALGRDCYFLIASVSDGGLKTGLRKASNIAGLRALRIDLDAGENKSYASHEAIAAVVTEAVEKKYLPKPWVVNSGGGYHCYWPLVETLNPVAWEVLAKRFLMYVRNSCGIAVDDPACTTDVARILRMPGTLNWKQPDNPRHVQLVMQGDAALPVQVWSGVMDRAGTPVPAAGKPRRITEAASIKSQLYRDLEMATETPVDQNVVFDQCGQLRYCRDNTDTISEPLWYAALGAAVFVDDSMVHALSAGHPDYTPDEAMRKAEQWKSAASGPTTCAKFYSLNPSGCTGCKYATTITTPIQLGKNFTRLVPVAVAETNAIATPSDSALPSEQTLTPVELHSKTSALLLQRGIDTAGKIKLRVAKDGVWGVRKDPVTGEMVPVRVWGPRPVVLLAAQEVEGQYNLAVAYDINMDAGSFKTKIVRMGQMLGASAIKEWGDNFMVTPHAQASDYLVNWATFVRDSPACELVGRHGFTDETNTKFVVGDTVYSKDGEAGALLRGNISTAGRLPTYRLGDVGAWIKAASAYAVVGAEPFACTVLAAFASPLVKFVHEHTPAALFIEGETGGGKTTAVRVAAAVWGHYEEFEQGGSSTVTGLRLLASKMNVLPVFVDETRSSDTRIARNFLYDMSNGSGRITGTPGQTTIAKDPFTLITVVTSNSPASSYFFDSDAPINRNTDAGISARVLPLKVDLTIARARDEFMPYLSNNSLAKNFGLAGAQYIRYVLSNEHYVVSCFREAHHYVKLALASVGVSGSGERAAVTIAALCAAGTVTNRLGLTSYDIDHLRGYLIRSFSSWINERRQEYAVSTDIAERFFEVHHRTATVILSSGLMAGTAMLAPMVVYSGRVYFMCGLVERNAAKTGLTRAEVQRQMSERNFTRIRPRFAEGVEYYEGPVGLYVAQTESVHSK